MQTKLVCFGVVFWFCGKLYFHLKENRSDCLSTGNSFYSCSYLILQVCFGVFVVGGGFFFLFRGKWCFHL